MFLFLVLINRMRKCGEFKVSLPNPRDGMFLFYSTVGGEKIMGGGTTVKGVL